MFCVVTKAASQGEKLLRAWWCVRAFVLVLARPILARISSASQVQAKGRA